MKISNLPIQNHHSDSQNYHLNDAGEIIIDNETCFLFACTTERPRALLSPKAINPDHQNMICPDQNKINENILVQIKTSTMWDFQLLTKYL